MSTITLPASVICDAVKRAADYRERRIQRARERMIANHPRQTWLGRLLGRAPLTDEQVITALKRPRTHCLPSSEWDDPAYAGLLWHERREKLLQMAQRAEEDGDGLVTINNLDMTALEGWL